MFYSIVCVILHDLPIVVAIVVVEMLLLLKAMPGSSNSGSKNNIFSSVLFHNYSSTCTYVVYYVHVHVH